jgi:hypothetical protein
VRVLEKALVEERVGLERGVFRLPCRRQRLFSEPPDFVMLPAAQLEGTEPVEGAGNDRRLAALSSSFGCCAQLPQRVPEAAVALEGFGPGKVLLDLRGSGRIAHESASQKKSGNGEDRRRGVSLHFVVGER